MGDGSLGRLHSILDKHDARYCPECNHEIGFGDIAWNNASTEAGTPYTWIYIHCAVCNTEIHRIMSWYPEIMSYEKDILLDVIEEDWKGPWG